MWNAFAVFEVDALSGRPLAIALSQSGQPIGWLADIFGFCAEAIVQVRDLYTETPALVLALGLVIAVPALVIAGTAIPRASRRKSHRKQTRRSNRGQASRIPDISVVDGVGQLVSVSSPLQTRVVGHAALKLGAAADNDFVLDGPGIDDLHAIILADPDAQHTVLRLAAPDKVNIYIDGAPQSSAPLIGGETIKIGRHIFSFEIDCHGLDPLPVHPAREITRAGNGERTWAGTRSNQADHGAGAAADRFSGH